MTGPLSCAYELERSLVESVRVIDELTSNRLIVVQPKGNQPKFHLRLQDWENDYLYPQYLEAGQLHTWTARKQDWVISVAGSGMRREVIKDINLSLEKRKIPCRAIPWGGACRQAVRAPIKCVQTALYMSHPDTQVNDYLYI